MPNPRSRQYVFFFIYPSCSYQNDQIDNYSCWSALKYFYKGKSNYFTKAWTKVRRCSTWILTWIFELFWPSFFSTENFNQYLSAFPPTLTKIDSSFQNHSAVKNAAIRIVVIVEFSVELSLVIKYRLKVSNDWPGWKFFENFLIVSTQNPYFQPFESFPL